MDKETKKLIYTLLRYGTKAAKLNKKQEMKLQEWVLAYAIDDLGVNGVDMMSIQEMRLYIDNWEHPDLSPEDYKYYYVDKSSNGKSLWDLI